MNIKNYIGRQTGLSGLELNTNIRRGQIKTVGHEIGHGINLHHHDIFTDDQQNPDPNYRCIMENGFTIKVSGNTKTVVVATVYRSFHIPDYKVR